MTTPTYDRSQRLAARARRSWRRAVAAGVAAALGMGAAAGALIPGTAGAQVTGPPTSLDLRVLVVSTGDRASDAGLELMARTMDQTGTPYDVLNAATTDLTEATLRDGGRGKYNGIILTQADLFTTGGSAFTGDEWRTLHAYERDFGVREAVVAGFPAFSPANDLDYGMGTIGASLRAQGRWTGPAGTGRLFSYVNTANTLDILEYSVWGTPRTDGTGPTVTPLLVDDAEASHVFISKLDYPDGREVLLSTVGNAWYRLHSTVLAYQFLDFATKGLFIGGRTVSLSTHSDDLFLADDLWDPVNNVTDPTRSYRISAADLDATVAGSNAFRAEHPLAAGWRVQHAYNGVGASLGGTPQPRITRAIGQDTRLNSASNLRNYGRSTSLVVERTDQRENRLLIRPGDIAAPAGTVTKVVLSLRVTSTGTLPVEVCPVTQSWSEGSGNGGLLDTTGASWTYRTTVSNASRWSTAGGTVAAAACVTGSLTGSGVAELDITPIWRSWSAGTRANNGMLVRATTTGLATVASAEASSANRPTIGIDSVSAPDGLTAAVVRHRNEFGFINHTYEALQMDRLCPDPDEPQPDECPRTDYRTAYDDIARNRTVWTDLALPGYEQGLTYLLSDSHAGLHDRMGTEEDASDDVPFPQGANPAFLQAAEDLGVRYIASDSSRPNQDREQRVPGFDLFLTPRFPTNVYVNATTPAQNTDEYNWIYHDRYVAMGQDPCTIPGAICQTKTYDELLAWEADTTVSHMLSGRAWPHYFHQSNLRNYGGGRSLLLDWMDAVMTRYEQLFTLPVRSPAASQLGPDAEERLVAAERHVRGSVELATGVVTLVADGDARPLVTGLAGGPNYGGQSVGKVDVDATPRAFTAENQVRDVLAPPPPPAPATTTTAPPTTEAPEVTTTVPDATSTTTATTTTTTTVPEAPPTTEPPTVPDEGGATTEAASGGSPSTAVTGGP